MDFYIQKLVQLYSQNANADYAEWSKAYLRNQFEFLGIRAPIRRALTKEFTKENGLPAKNELQKVMEALWEMPEREYQYAALDLLRQARKNVTPADMPWLEQLIVSKSWWDTVDVLAPHIMGYMLSKYPELIEPYADKWIEDENFWLQRTAILYQLYSKEKTNEERLFSYIIRRADSNEFFVQKAIGWSLRQYAKTNPEGVQSFVATHPLKPLSKREALKHFRTN